MVTSAALGHFEIVQFRGHIAATIVAISQYQPVRIVPVDGLQAALDDLSVQFAFYLCFFAKLVVHILSETWFIDQVETELIRRYLFESFGPHPPMGIKRHLCFTVFPKIVRFIEPGIDAEAWNPVKVQAYV